MGNFKCTQCFNPNCKGDCLTNIYAPKVNEKEIKPSERIREISIEAICSRFGKRTVELPSVREIEDIIRSQPTRDGYYCGNPTTVAKNIIALLQEKITSKP